MMKKVIFLVLVLGFVYSQSLHADMVYLKNGACYDGEVVSQNDEKLTIKLDIGELTINNSDIESIHITEKKKEIKKETKLSEMMLIISRLKKEAVKINDYRCKTRSELYDGSTISGTVLCKAPDKLKAAYLVTSNLQDIGRMEVKAVTDGKVFWLYYPQLNIIYKQAVGSEDSIAPGMDELMPALLLDKLNDSNCTFLGYESVDNVDTACFETVIEDGASDLSGMGANKEVAVCKMYFRKKDGFLIKNVAYDKKGKILFINSTGDIEINININENEFYFKAPEGAEVLDISAPANLDAVF